MTTTFLSVARASALACLLFCRAVPLVQAQPLSSPSPGAGTSMSVVLDVAGLRRQLAAPAGAAARFGDGITYRISLPTLHGVQAFVLSETFVVPASDEAGHQRLRTFVGNAEGDNAAGQRVSLVRDRRPILVILKWSKKAGQAMLALLRKKSGASDTCPPT